MAAGFFTLESNSVRRAVRAGGSGRGRHDLRVLGQLKPFPVTRLEGGIVPQRALSGWRKIKLGRELPEAASDAGQLVRDRVGPAQVVYGFGLHGI
jgi:hypothetical protein